MKKSILTILVLVGMLNATCTSNGDNTVSCDESGLMWQDDSEVGTVSKTWQEAISYCEGLTLVGHDDWRLPNITELKSIRDRANKINPSLKDGFKQRSTVWFWSSTTLLGDTSRAWLVNFYNGDDDWVGKTDAYYVRCTR